MIQWLGIHGDYKSREMEQMVNRYISARASEAGVCRGSDTPNYICGVDIDMYIPLEKPNSHANCMQHLLRCWERQADGSEYKKTLPRPGLRPGPRSGSSQRSRKPPSWWAAAGCPFPKNPIPSSTIPAAKISSDAVGHRYS